MHKRFPGLADARDQFFGVKVCPALSPKQHKTQETVNLAQQLYKTLCSQNATQLTSPVTSVDPSPRSTFTHSAKNKNISRPHHQLIGRTGNFYPTNRLQARTQLRRNEGYFPNAGYSRTLNDIGRNSTRRGSRNQRDFQSSRATHTSNFKVTSPVSQSVT